ncbi:MAG: hypothetical protein J6A28_04075 [Clostridia bacterium]|nr:hypothetical protein [Clostridia bacterium]
MVQAKQKSKKSLKKITVAFIALGVALVATIGAIIAVYAATLQNLNSSFQISYSVGENVSVGLSTSSQWTADEGNTTNPSEDEVDFEVGEDLLQNSNGLYVVSAENQNQSLTFNSGDIELKPDGVHHVYFTVENLTPVDIEATVSDNSLSSNMKTTYSVQVVEFSQEDQAFTNEGEPTEVTLTNNSYTFTIAKDTIVRFIVSTRVDNQYANAYYKSTSENGIAWAFVQPTA